MCINMCNKVFFAYFSLLIFDCSGQTTPNIHPFPTAPVVEEGSLTFTCTGNTTCSSEALFAWFLNGEQTLLLVWRNNSCSYGEGNTELSYTCGIVQNKCQITLTLTKVKRSQHEDVWGCQLGLKSNRSTIIVNVPITSVDVTSPSLSPVNVSENAPSTFVCETSAGRPQATIMWYKQLGTNAAVPVQDDNITTKQSGTLSVTRSTLQYTPTRSDHDYRVYCTAYNIDSTYNSTNKPQLYVQYAPDSGPAIEGHTNGSTFYVLNGKSLSLACSIEGGRPLASLSWTCFSGAVKDQSTGNTTTQQVTWTAAIDHDEQHCTCLASHQVWTSTRQVYATIEALFPPSSPTFTVQSQPVSVTVSTIEGTRVSVACSSTSNPHPLYSWTPRGSSPNRDILTLTSVSTSDSGVYTCIVTNTMTPTQGDPENGSNNASITLDVLFPPRTPILRYNTSDGPIISSTLNVVRGDDFSTYCTAEGNPSPSYQWTSQSANNNKLTVTDIQTDTSWTCTATNKMVPSGADKQTNSSTATVTANVLYSASIKEFTINGVEGDGPFTYNENTTVAIACVVDSNPGSNITIYRDGFFKETAAITKEIIHTVKEASCLDAGMYSCAARNQYNGNAFPTLSQQVFIRCPPRLLDSVNNNTYYYALNKTVTLNLTVTAYPEPTYTWFKQDNNITRGISTIAMGVSKNIHQSNLTLKHITQDDLGQYKVGVTNSQGTLEHLLFVAAQDTPRKPTNVTSKLVVHNSAVIQWVPGFDGGQDQTFFIEYWPSSQNGFPTIQQKNDTRDSTLNITLTNLTPETEYTVQVFARNSIGNSIKSIQATFTTKKNVNNEEQTSLTAAAAGGGIAGAVITLAVGVLVFLMIRRRKNSTSSKKSEADIYVNTMIDRSGGYTMDDSSFDITMIDRSDRSIIDKPMPVDVGTYTTERKEKEIAIAIEPPKITQSAILLRELEKMVFSPDAATAERLSEEFQKFREGMTKEHNNALQNRSRNKYRNLYAYDDTRVVLDKWDDANDTDYINACYIQGFKKPNAYIASQGPIKNNLNDFWRMVWQTNAVQIVMLTNIIEHGKEKCIRYWPEDGSEMYGQITVTLAARETFSSFVIRTFRVNKDFEPPRQVQQFHFTAWPDKDVPAFCSSLVHFRSKVKAAASACDGPVVVHCSAGIGRTGTYIAIDYLVDEAEELGYVDVVGCVTALREQRVNMVQKEKQYVFVHLSLVEILLLETSVVSTSDFVEAYKQLVKPVNGVRQIDADFDLLWKLSPKVEELSDNTDAPLAEQNVTHDDEYMPSYSETGTCRYGEVIDAAFLPLYRDDNAMIIATTPTEWTIEKFWNLVYHQQVYTIVMMNQEGVYWPGDNGTFTHGDITISNNGAVKKGSHYVVKLTLFNNGTERDIQLLLFGTWEGDASVPDDPSHVLSALDIVGSNQKKTGNHPVVVHCMDGVERSGLFCVIAALLDRTKIEQDVAISQVIQEIRNRRKNVIPNVEQFEFCHDVVCAFLQQFDSYSNFTFGE